MSQETDNIRSFGDGNVYRAPVGTDFPASADTEVDLDDWSDLGLISEDGPQFSFDKEKKDKYAWQSMDPVRTMITKVPKAIKVGLMQTDLQALVTALGGGTVTEDPPGNFTYEPPEASEVDECALMVEGRDGDLVYRFCYRRVQNLGKIEFPWQREDTVTYDAEFQVLQPSGGEKPFFVQSNDDALADLVGS